MEPGSWRRTVRSTRVLPFLYLLGSGVASGQGVRVTGVTSMQAVDLRPLIEDSVPAAQAGGSGPFRTLGDGRVVRCIEGEAFCRFRSSGQRTLVAPLVQDLQAVAWGLGEGISLQAHVRARGSLGGANVDWPRADDEFDAIEAWLEIDRGPARTRVGRQWTTGSLGVRNYDGASVLLRRGRLRVELLGGRSLVAGLNEPIAGSALGALDDLPPDEHGWLVGLSLDSRLGTRGAVGASWQRVIRADRAALYSDRVAADAAWRLFGTSADASVAWDITGQQFNEAAFRLSRRVSAAVSTSVEARRHRPFFDAWTIWGAFSPVAFDELRAAGEWRRGSIGADLRAGWRRYGETDAGLESAPLRRDGWRAGAGGEWLPDERWMLHADYDIDIGFGASRSDVVAGARWMPDESSWVGVAASGLQHIYEFRVGTGRIAGLRVDAGVRLPRGMRLAADAALYSHRTTITAVPNWSQRRFSLRLEWVAGADPGESSAGRRNQ